MTKTPSFETFHCMIFLGFFGHFFARVSARAGQPASPARQPGGRQPATRGRAYSCTRFNKFRCYRSGPRRLLGEYGGIEADRQTTSSRQLAADS